MLAGVINNTTCFLQVNDTNYGTETTDALSSYSTVRGIGARSNGTATFDGSMSLVSIFPSALSSSELSYIYNLLFNGA